MAESPVLIIVEQEKRFTIREAQMGLINLGVDVAVGYENVLPSAVNKIYECRSPSHMGKCGSCDTRCIRKLSKSLSAPVPVQGVRLLHEIGYENVQIAVVI